MPDVTLALQAAGPAGVTPTRTAIAAGTTYHVRNSGRIALLFEKTGSNNAVITVVSQATLAGLAVTDQTFTVVATTGDVTAAKFPPAVFNDSSGDLTFTTDEGTGLTCAVLAI